MRIYIFTALLVLTLLFAAFSAHSLNATSSWSIQTIDEGGAKGFLSMALDSNNNPHIAYIGHANGNWHNPLTLMYASWNGTAWIIENVTLGSGTACIALDSNNNPHIVFDTVRLSYASLNSTGWNIQTVDEEGSAGSLALDSADNPYIAYTGMYGELKYARWTGLNWSIQTVDSEEDFSNLLFLEVDTNNNPHILYGYRYPSPQGTLVTIKYATHNSSGWNIQSVVSDAGAGNFGNIALDSNAYPHFVYSRPRIYPEYGHYDSRNSTLIYVNWNGSEWNTQTVNSNINWRGSASFLALDSQDYPHIVYYNETKIGELGVLMYSRWTGTAWDTQIVDPDSSLNAGSIAVDSNGTPHIAYFGRTIHPSNYIAHIKYATPTESTETSPTPLEITIAIVAIVVVAVAVGAGLLIYYKKRKHEAEITNS